jgi:hypothetical protein
MEIGVSMPVWRNGWVVANAFFTKAGTKYVGYCVEIQKELGPPVVICCRLLPAVSRADQIPIEEHEVEEH